MERSEILSIELKDLLTKIEQWLLMEYNTKSKIPIDKLSGTTLIYHLEFQKNLMEVLTHIRKIIEKGYYSQNEKLLLNDLRKMWISEQKGNPASN